MEEITDRLGNPVPAISVADYVLMMRHLADPERIGVLACLVEEKRATRMEIVQYLDRHPGYWSYDTKQYHKTLAVLTGPVFRGLDIMRDLGIVVKDGMGDDGEIYILNPNMPLAALHLIRLLFPAWMRIQEEERSRYTTTDPQEVAQALEADKVVKLSVSGRSWHVNTMSRKVNGDWYMTISHPDFQGARVEDVTEGDSFTVYTHDAYAKMVAHLRQEER